MSPEPRNSRLLVPPPVLFASSTMIAACGCTIGLPFGAWATPGASAICATSAWLNEPISSVAPAESTMAWSGRSLASTVLITPAPMPSSESITATTVATPTMVTSEAPAREGRAARFIAETAQICRKKPMSPRLPTGRPGRRRWKAACPAPPAAAR